MGTSLRDIEPGVRWSGGFQVWAHAARVAGLIAVLAYALIGAPALTARVSTMLPFDPSDRQAYDLATHDEFSSLLPVQHIVYEETSGVLPAGADGCFQPGSDTIVIRLRGGTLPATEYASILRHEYGHALLYAWAMARGYGAAGFDSALTARPIGALDVPAPLAGPASDYRAEPGLFGTYARVSLGEWLAEAYSSYATGEGGLPRRTQAFFDAMMDPGPRP